MPRLNALHIFASLISHRPVQFGHLTFSSKCGRPLHQTVVTVLSLWGSLINCPLSSWTKENAPGSCPLYSPRYWFLMAVVIRQYKPHGHHTNSRYSSRGQALDSRTQSFALSSFCRLPVLLCSFFKGWLGSSFKAVSPASLISFFFFFFWTLMLLSQQASYKAISS